MQIEAASEVAQDVTKELTRFQRYTGNLIDNALNAGTKVLIVIVLFFIGRFLINIIRKLLRKSLERSSVNNGNIKFIDATVRILLYILLIGSVGEHDRGLCHVKSGCGKKILYNQK